MGIFWCIFIKNNVKSCRKFYEKAQTVNFSVFTMCGRELLAVKVGRKLKKKFYGEEALKKQARKLQDAQAEQLTSLQV